jgi:choline dehydrogenase-like flavoprotein
MAAVVGVTARGSRRDVLHDVVVVGSGAAGGMVAYVFAQAGVKVLMLEAGRDYRALTEWKGAPDEILRRLGLP